MLLFSNFSLRLQHRSTTFDRRLAARRTLDISNLCNGEASGLASTPLLVTTSMQALPTQYKVGLKCERKVVQVISKSIQADLSICAGYDAMPSTRLLRSPLARQAPESKQTSAGFREDVQERERGPTARSMVWLRVNPTAREFQW
jgi:hypothetical protein